MNTIRKIEISGLNIVTQPHTPEGYIELFKKMAKERQYIRIRGNDCLMLSSARPLDSNDWTKGIVGEIIKFSEIEQDRNWVNVKAGKFLEDGLEPQLPQDLKPNGAYFPYIFYPKSKGYAHKLFYVSHSRNHKGKYDNLSPNLLKKMFDSLFMRIKIELEYESIEVTVLPDSEALDTIFRIPSLHKLELVIKAPNPDDLADAESEIFQRMEGINVSETYHEYKSKQSEFIKPDDKLKIQAKVAANNGYVKGYGKDIDGTKVEKSTKEIPLKRTVILDTLKDTLFSALERFRL
ncbi:DUF4747 family protein [[Pasteurella] aerogenes]